MSSAASSISSQSSSDSPVESHDAHTSSSTNPWGVSISGHGRRTSQLTTSSPGNMVGITRTHHMGDTVAGLGPHRSSSSESAPGIERRRPVHSHSSYRRLSDEQTLSEFLRDGARDSARQGYSAEVRRMHLLAADRKRRLTSSEHDSGRRRTINGSFHNRGSSGQSPQLDGSSSPQRVYWPRRTDSTEASRAGYLDLTSPSSSRPQLPPGESSATSSYKSTREYVLPKWQPDSEASACPICGRAFTWRFRRHHCRKCGRVVCDACSPHRITIPRQFIVHSPDQSRPTSIIGMNDPTQVETIDLTDEQASTSNGGIVSTPIASNQASNPGLGGGEKVRLCNPCVPDPQPHPHPTWSSPATTPVLAEGDSLPPHPLAYSTLRHHNSYPFTEEAREARRQRGHGVIFHPSIARYQTRPRQISEEGLPPYSSFGEPIGPTASQTSQPPTYQAHSDSRPRPSYAPLRPNSMSTSTSGHRLTGVMSPGPLSAVIVGQRTTPLPPQYHTRYQSLASASSPQPAAGTRPRTISRLEMDPSLQRFIDQVSSSPSSRPPPPTRPHLHECDICPICRRALPPRGADGDEATREAHIMQCIAARDTSAARVSAHEGQSPMHPPPNAPIYLLPFVATEKDCVGEDGSRQECSICMVEYDVADQLARLECLCKFHKECIVEWFGRKRECPVHKIA